MNSKPQSNFCLKTLTVSYDDFDQMQLLMIFPEEIWKLILENVTDLETLESLSSASSFFRKRLLSRQWQTLALFPKVFQCLASNKIQEDMSQGFPDAAGNDWKFPWGLRGVCTKWNQTIEEFFRTNDINSFIAKPLELLCYERNFDEQIKLVAKFGQTIKSVRICLDDEYANCYFSLVLLLKNLPSLKELQLEYMAEEDNDIEHLTRIIQETPCPKMDKIEKLILTGGLPSQIINELLKHNTALQVLKINSVNDQNQCFDYSINLPNLKKLDVIIKDDEDLKQLKRFGKNWKLTSYCGYFPKLCSWFSMLHMCKENWGATLKELQMTLPGYVSGKSRSEFCEMALKITTHERLQEMVTLKSIKIVTYCTISLDFLLGCQENLEIIEVDWPGPSSEMNKSPFNLNCNKNCQIIEYIGFETEMENSNIWQLFPRLQCFEFRHKKVYRSSMYNYK